MTTYFAGIAMLLIVISPLLVPIAISGVRAIANWPTTYTRLRTFVAGLIPALSAANHRLSITARTPGAQLPGVFAHTAGNHMSVDAQGRAAKVT